MPIRKEAFNEVTYINDLHNMIQCMKYVHTNKTEFWLTFLGLILVNKHRPFIKLGRGQLNMIFMKGRLEVIYFEAATITLGALKLASTDLSLIKRLGYVTKPTKHAETYHVA